ncbi:variant erythrocyte surface antigen-1 family protein [Babesia caballi]|uniref:Variant erythrocyte surface antigen-1 family protein n=1 Tax=Babesia caballi TaxID=5871 RepID=A0AAV4LP57_BABCB|nr:variant erythrocyte surface antigen-1 family protein [Babesia caballi]
MSPLTHHLAGDTSPYSHLSSYLSLPHPPHPELTSPIITGGGILPANVAKYQVCNAVLNFVIRFLEGLYRIKVDGDTYKSSVYAVIATLRKCVGSGQVPEGFGKLVEGIETNVDAISKKVLQSSQGKLKNVFDEFKKICDHYNGQLDSGPKVEAKELDNFLNAVESALQKDNSSNFATYCDNLKTLFGNSELKGKEQKNDAALTYSALESNIESVTNAARALNSEIRGIHTNTGKNDLLPNAAVFTAVRDAAIAFIAELQTKEYTSYYYEAEWSQVTGNTDKVKTCAKIFLGCVPLYYQALTYIDWGCHDKGGGWRNLTLASGTMRSYFDSQGLLSLYVDKARGARTLPIVRLEGSSSSSYATFTKQLQKKVTTNGNQLADECPLSALFYGASCYFRYRQIKVSDRAFRTPKTIRGMLYFLAALQFSSAYDELNNHIDTVLHSPLNVADSGTSATGNTLSAADVKSYLASTFLLPPSLLGWLQGPSASISDEPWLHSLFSNSQFNLSILPSGAGIFGALSSYAYALQF